MGESADDYRQRAAHCRKLAETATDDVIIERLIELAEDFEEEARKLDAGEAR
jgi:hypothetical protein